MGTGSLCLRGIFSRIYLVKELVQSDEAIINNILRSDEQPLTEYMVNAMRKSMRDHFHRICLYGIRILCEQFSLSTTFM